MLSKKIVDADAFMDMPLSTQALYFHLSVRADDDGFVGNPKKIMRMVGANDDDYKVLVGKRFVLQFPSGVCVIKHWLIHNYIQNDRYNETQYLDEKSALVIKDNKSYTECIQSVSRVDTQVRLGKVRLGKDRTLSVQSTDTVDNHFETFWGLYPKKVGKTAALSSWKKAKRPLLPALIASLEKQIASEQWRREGGRFIPNPATWLNQGRWDDEVSTTVTKIKHYD
jgi:hypothetical protein